jgi:hypothetical protein
VHGEVVVVVFVVVAADADADVKREDVVVSASRVITSPIFFCEPSGDGYVSSIHVSVSDRDYVHDDLNDHVLRRNHRSR